MRLIESGYSLLTVAVALFITAVVLIGGMSLLQQYDLIPKNTEVSPTVNQNNSDSAEEPNTKEVDPTKGVIQGTYIFPSETIPETLVPCAENVQTHEVICSASLGETGHTNTFMIIVPEGSYYVYAINTEDPNNYKAYYTEFVTCGLNIDCPSHEKIAVEVAAGQTVSDIKPHDWYDL